MKVRYDRKTDTLSMVLGDNAPVVESETILGSGMTCDLSLDAIQFALAKSWRSGR